MESSGSSSASRATAADDAALLEKSLVPTGNPQLLLEPRSLHDDLVLYSTSGPQVFETYAKTDFIMHTESYGPATNNPAASYRRPSLDQPSDPSRSMVLESMQVCDESYHYQAVGLVDMASMPPSWCENIGALPEPDDTSLDFHGISLCKLYLLLLKTDCVESDIVHERIIPRVNHKSY